MDAKQLAEIKAREQAATPGCWYTMRNAHGGLSIFFYTGEGTLKIGEIYEPTNVNFIIESRNNYIPLLIAEVERLQIERDAAIGLHKECSSELSLMRKALEISCKVALRSENIHPSWFTAHHFIQQAQEQEELI